MFGNFSDVCINLAFFPDGTLLVVMMWGYLLAICSLQSVVFHHAEDIWIPKFGHNLSCLLCFGS